ncbi:MAG: class I adenylate-forming enzyme family protein [Pseudomonadota bacterium]
MSESGSGETPVIENLSEAIKEAVARVTAPGQPYEVVETEIDGTVFPVFKNAPENLRALYADGLAYGERDFYVYEEERCTFAEAWRRAGRVANALLAKGLTPGDRVGIALRNYPEWVEAFMGITAAGGIAVAMNAWWTGEELVYGIEDSGLKLLFADQERSERLAPHLKDLAIELITVRHETAGHGTWAEFLADASDLMPELAIAPDDNALILYTSGSTAHPKGVLTTHRAIISALLGWECLGVIGEELLGPTDEAGGDSPAMLLAVPLFHVAGLNVQLLSSFRPGRKVVGMYKWDPEEALKLIERERITAFNGVPTMAWEVIRSPNFGNYDLSSLTSMGGGGAAMAPDHARQINDKLSNGVAGTGYGMTETSGLGTTITGEALLGRPRSCGRPIQPMVSIKIVDAEGSELPRGESGEIWIHGPQNFRCYWNKPEATAETLTDGWVHTGDIGYMDEEDYVFITDREKDMVIRGGENIGCQEVEAVLYDHPAVSECAVFGLPDERLGETLAAVIMRHPGETVTEADLQAHAAAHLARFKVPEHIWIQDEQLPRIASGKIFKRGLKDQAIDRLSAR